MTQSFKEFEAFSNRLKILRQEKDLSLRDLAHLTGIGRTTLQQYESKKCEPSLKMILKISVFFGVTFDFLVGYTDDRTKKAND
jgi:transcriptional regulator with XRE-family HTH domain